MLTEISVFYSNRFCIFFNVLLINRCYSFCADLPSLGKHYHLAGYLWIMDPQAGDFLSKALYNFQHGYLWIMDPQAGEVRDEQPYRAAPRA